MKYTIKKKLRRLVLNVSYILNIDKLLMKSGFYNTQINTAIKKFGETKISDIEILKTDIKNCYYKFLVVPEEYFLFGFWAKKWGGGGGDSFLSDKYKNRMLYKKIGEKVFYEDLYDKYKFYLRTKAYFKRLAIKLGGTNCCTYDEFKRLLEKRGSLFVKPLTASCGIGIHQLNSFTDQDTKMLYEKYSEGEWIIEEKINQSKEIAIWNKSSVNTVRLPCFLKEDGTFHILQPFFRTGRSGSIVDNGGSGGIFACIDEQSGIIITDGIDENNITYSRHPDTNIQYLNWKIPQWAELTMLAKNIFVSCFPYHRYIGFDFAYTDDGWVLVEGNWGQFLGQYASKKGVKWKFIEYME